MVSDNDINKCRKKYIVLNTEVEKSFIQLQNKITGFIYDENNAKK